jgi:hypothetical protein
LLDVTPPAVLNITVIMLLVLLIHEILQHRFSLSVSLLLPLRTSSKIVCWERVVSAVYMKVAWIMGRLVFQSLASHYKNLFVDRLLR